MKRIGIITLHYNCNYGAVLQAYSLQYILEELGYEAYIIDYENPYGKKELTLISNSILQNLRTLFFLKKRIIRIRRFKKFMKSYYKLTESIYDYKRIRENIFNFDIYITGSDQTFNLGLSGEKEIRKVYFLPWVKNTKKISYASSMGEKVDNLDKKDEKWLKVALSEYDHLSVREISTANYIEKLGIKRPDVVMDPTLLLTKGKWDKIANTSAYTNDHYILFYSVLSEPWVIENVKRISKLLNLKVIAPHYQNRYEIGTAFVRAEECGPSEFLDLIKNAYFICTTSFHGTVFSLLYNKPFIAFSLKEGNRIGNLLNIVNQGCRIVKKGEEFDLSELLNNDFERVNRILDLERKKSIKTLVEYIGEK